MYKYQFLFGKRICEILHFKDFVNPLFTQGLYQSFFWAFGLFLTSVKRKRLPNFSFRNVKVKSTNICLTWQWFNNFVTSWWINLLLYINFRFADLSLTLKQTLKGSVVSSAINSDRKYIWERPQNRHDKMQCDKGFKQMYWRKYNSLIYSTTWIFSSKKY